MDQYLGFAVDADGAIEKIFGRDGQPTRGEVVTASDLDPHEREAIARDRSPSVYHWNDLVVRSGGTRRFVYARGKDFVPFSALEYVEQLRTRRADPKLGPATLQVQPFQTCNDDCTFCCTTEYRQRPIYRGRSFSRTEWFELIDRFADAGGRVMEIIGGGEPTLHPDFVDVLNHLTRRNVRAYLFTNGSRFVTTDGELNVPLLDAIARACVVLTVSLDGYRRRHLVHRKISFETTQRTFDAMAYIHRVRDPRRMAFYNSFILTGGPDQASNLEDLYECVARQAGWVDAIHIQNDFMSLSHLEFNVELARDQLQRTMDDHFQDTYIYYNYPLIARFGLRVPYALSTHNIPSSELDFCPRGLLAPTVESGSNRVWPCGKYAGEAEPHHQTSFDTVPAQFAALRSSADHKNGMACDPCIHSSYNQSLLAISREIDASPDASFGHFYDRRIVGATMRWPDHEAAAVPLRDHAVFRTPSAVIG